MEPLAWQLGLRARRSLLLWSTAAVTAALSRSITAADDPAAVALPALQPVICRFDFEEPDAPPNALPASFVRNIAPSQGFPNFGSMRLTTAMAFSGRGSFEFELAGGSMSASVPTAIVPILPLADYTVSAKVRTEGLRNARARLVAWLHDKAGRAIHDSRAQSRLANTGGGWETLSVEIRGEYPDAADLVLELQLVQPGQFDALQPARDEPTPQDIAGRAWFDDVTIAHLSRIRLAMTQPGNIVHVPQTPQLLIEVHEQTNQPLTARLRVFDLDGASVFDSTFPAPRGRHGGAVHVPVPGCGWYRALLEISNSGVAPSRGDWLDFIVLSEASGHESAHHQFGVELHGDSPLAFEITPDLVAALDVRAAIVPVWHRTSGWQHDQIRQGAQRRMIDQLLRRSIDLTFSLDVVPDQLVTAARVESSGVLELLAKDPQLWRPYLDDVLVSFGLEVHRWQIGPASPASTLWVSTVRNAVDSAAQSIADFVPDPQVYAVWPLEQALAFSTAVEPCAVTIPHEVRPESLGAYAETWSAEARRNLVVNLDVLPDELYTPHQRVSDLAHRVLQAWKADLPLMTIEAPWRFNDDRETGPMPDPIFGAWRMLATQLGGRVHSGELRLPGDQHCWIVRDPSQGQAALVAWSDASALSQSSLNDRILRSQLADGAVEVIDLFGNRSIVEPIAGVHSIGLSDMPVFINNVNLELVQFRGGVAIDPDFVPAISKIHEHHIVLHNPWPIAVSGTIRLTAQEQWALTPSAQEFTIQAHGEARLPLRIIPDRSIVAGPKTIDIHIDLAADQAYTMHLKASLEVGLKDIDLTASCSIARNPRTGQEDLIITEAVTNKGEQRVNLDLYVLAPGLGQNRRTIVGLGPGETAVRTFRIANGAITLAGQPVRVGVAEREGTTRLNHLLRIPQRQDMAHVAAE
jgi:hypothetical protein